MVKILDEIKIMEKLKIWIFAEIFKHEIISGSLELITFANNLNKENIEISAIIIGSNVDKHFTTLKDYGCDKIYFKNDNLLKEYQQKYYASLLEHLCLENKPDILVFSATRIGSELSSTLGVRLKTGVSAHCIGLKLNPENKLIQEVPGFGGNIIAQVITPNTVPQIATVMPGMIKKFQSIGTKTDCEIVEIAYQIDALENLPELVSFTEKETTVQSIEDAEVIIAGGYGLGSKENWEKIEELAGLLNAGVGCTRPAADEGWCSEDLMIGQSGKVVRPKLYLGIGISGVMHHIVGMKDSETIIAINNDPKAPIFEVCDYIIEADAQEILPAVIKEIRASN